LSPGPLDGNEPSQRPSAHVVLRPLGSPLTLGMSGLAIASLVQSGVELHWTPPDQTFQAGLILVAVPFVLQLLACIFSYLARDGATGAAVGVLATSWLAIGLIHIAAKPGATSAALGLLLLAAGGALGAAAAAIASSKPLPGAIFAAAALRFAIAGVYQLSTITFWEHAAGVLGLLVTALALYATLAFELEGQRERPVLPTFRRGRAAAAIRDGAGSDRDRLVTEPGVRETT
jgi:succinate-acetate transporter protein